MTRNKKTTQRRRQRGAAKRIVVTPVVATRTRRRKANPQRRRGNSNWLGSLGSSVGSLVGGGPGSRLGRMVGNGIARIAGRGDYVLSGNVQNNSLAGSTPPQFGDATGTTRIRHREYIADVSGSQAFSSRQYQLQPGLTQLFPWLSRFASCYEQYRIMGLVVEFKSTSASALNSTNTALGVVGMVTQYDAHEPPFQNKQEAENYLGCQSCSPSQSMLHFVECAKGQNPLDKLYVRTAALGEGADVKFYDMGILNVFTAGMQAAAVIGELWVSYDIEFSKPKLPPGGVFAFGSDFYQIGAINMNNTAPLAVRTYPAYGTLGTSLSGTAGNLVVNIPQEMAGGIYHAYFSVNLATGTGTGPFSAVPVYGTGISALSAYTDNGGNATSYLNFSAVSGALQNQFGAVMSFYVTPYRTVDSTVTIPLSNYNQIGAAARFELFPSPNSAPTNMVAVQYRQMANKVNLLMQQYSKLLALLPSEVPETIVEEREERKEEDIPPSFDQVD